MVWVPWSPMGFALPEYGDADLETAKYKSAAAAACTSLSWIEVTSTCWKLVWPDGGVRLYLIQEEAT